MWKGCERRSTYWKHSSQRYKNVIQMCCCRLSHQRELQIWDLFMCSCGLLTYLWITGSVGMCDLSHVRCLCLRLVIIILRWWNRLFTFLWLYLTSVVSCFFLFCFFSNCSISHCMSFVCCCKSSFSLFELNISSTMCCLIHFALLIVGFVWLMNGFVLLKGGVLLL